MCTQQQVQAIVNAYAKFPTEVQSLELMADQTAPLLKEFRVFLVGHPSLTLVISPEAPAIEAYIHIIARASTRIDRTALPTVFAMDHARAIVPSISYALLSGSPENILGQWRPDLGEGICAVADQRIGAALRGLHGLENDWFGPIGQEHGPDGADACYSWQECFTRMVDRALDDAEASAARAACGVQLPFDTCEARGWLSRAIGTFLFDDVEVPALVWNPRLDWDEDVWVNVRGDPHVAAASGVVPHVEAGFVVWSGAIWGDALLEGALYAPSPALLEGYGGTPMLFARQYTKRLWYTLYAALDALSLLMDEEIDTEVQYSGAWGKERLRSVLAETGEVLREWASAQ